MNRLIELMLIVYSCTFANNIELNEKNPVNFTTPKNINVDTLICEKSNFHEKKSFNEFLEKLAFRESSGNWKAINRFGYMGKYQMGKLALRDIGMDSITPIKFRKDSSIFSEKLQDVAIKKYIRKNRKYLKDCIERYRNTTINGIFITESSILGAAHLVGHRSVKEWLNCGGLIKKVDGNGTTIESYLKLFSGYKISC